MLVMHHGWTEWDKLAQMYTQTKPEFYQSLLIATVIFCAIKQPREPSRHHC